MRFGVPRGGGLCSCGLRGDVVSESLVQFRVVDVHLVLYCVHRTNHCGVVGRLLGGHWLDEKPFIRWEQFPHWGAVYVLEGVVWAPVLYWVVVGIGRADVLYC